MRRAFPPRHVCKSFAGIPTSTLRFPCFDRGVTHARRHDDAQIDDNDDDPADILEAILDHMIEREDSGYNDVAVNVSVGVSFGAIVGVGVNGQEVSLSVGLGAGLVAASPPLTSFVS